MFCKFCFDANRAEFNDHNLKDPQGKIVCAYLNNIKCYNCGGFGHTPKYCKNKPLVLSYDAYEFKFCVPAYDSSDDSICDIDDDYLNDEIIWGLGKKSLRNKSWADICNA